MSAVTYDFNNAPAALASELRNTSAIHTEWFWRFDKGFLTQGDNTTFTNWGVYFNESRVLDPAILPPAVTAPLYIAADGLNSAVYAPSGKQVMRIFTELYSGAAMVGFRYPEVERATAPELPPFVELTVPHATSVSYSSGPLGEAFLYEPFKLYTGFRPMASAAPNEVFVDHLAAAGMGNLTCRIQKTPPHTPSAVTGTAAMFAGFINRSAMDKNAADILDSDIILGGIVRADGVGKVVANGSVIHSLSGLDWNGGHDIGFEVSYRVNDSGAEPAYAAPPNPLSALNTISILIDGNTFFDLGNGSFELQTPVVVPVNFAGAVLAAVCDAGVSDPATCSIFARLVIEQYWDYPAETARGEMYTAGDNVFWSNFRKTQEIV